MHTKVPFGISRDVTTEVKDLFLQIDEGIGEGAPTRYYKDFLDNILKDVDKVLPLIGDDPFAIEDILAKVEKATNSRVLLAAVDIALYDLVGKRLGVPVYKLLGLSADKAPQTSFTIGIDTTEVMVQKALEAKEFPILKIKLGGSDDMNVMAKIREALPNHILRVDCNCGWTAENALPRIEQLAELGVEFVEQPLPPEDIEGLKKVFKSSKLPIYLDESVRTAADVPRVASYCHGVNFKLMKTGGIREALRGIYTAKTFGLKTMLGCMLESSIGITAAAHLAPLIDCADLDGNILLADDPYTGMTLENGWIKLPEKPGIGVTPVA
jgi:L-alanine-DL-glutamate epimerase-like enolase superfamily enzyme